MADNKEGWVTVGPEVLSQTLFDGLVEVKDAIFTKDEFGRGHVQLRIAGPCLPENPDGKHLLCVVRPQPSRTFEFRLGGQRG